MQRKVEIYTRENNIVIDVDGWDNALVLDPNGAARLVEILHEAAVSLGVTERVTAGPTVIPDILRQTMITRCQHLLRCFEGQPDTKKASEIVDLLLGMLP